MVNPSMYQISVSCQVLRQNRFPCFFLFPSIFFWNKINVLPLESPRLLSGTKVGVYELVEVFEVVDVFDVVELVEVFEVVDVFDVVELVEVFDVVDVFDVFEVLEVFEVPEVLLDVPLELLELELLSSGITGKSGISTGLSETVPS